MPACDKFGKITVQPGYAPGSWCIRWQLSDETLLAGKAYVYRSYDGQAWGKEPINLNKPVIGCDYYVDFYAAPQNNTDQLFYRISIAYNGKIYDSPIGGQYDFLTETQQGIVRKIVNLDLLDMRDAQNGYRAILYKPLLSGVPCPDCENVDTGTARQSSLCPTCYGTRFVGGYGDPVETWIKRLGDRTLLRRDGPGGAGVDDQEMVQFHGLAFPVLKTGDVLAIQATSEKWIVGKPEWPLFRGIIPIATTFSAALMKRGDIRQQLPIPDAPALPYAPPPPPSPPEPIMPRPVVINAGGVLQVPYANLSAYLNAGVPINPNASIAPQDGSVWSLAQNADPTQYASWVALRDPTGTFDGFNVEILGPVS